MRTGLPVAAKADTDTIVAICDASFYAEQQLKGYFSTEDSA
jgi:hypothetical protein